MKEHPLHNPDKSETAMSTYKKRFKKLESEGKVDYEFLKGKVLGCYCSSEKQSRIACHSPYSAQRINTLLKNILLYIR
jgi:hypothetical protein